MATPDIRTINRFAEALGEASTLDSFFKECLVGAGKSRVAAWASISVGDDGSFSAVALGVDFKLVSMPIVLNGETVGLEHRFVGSFFGSERVHFAAYQLTDGVLYRESAGATRISGVNSSELVYRILECLAEAVIASDIYKPLY